VLWWFLQVDSTVGELCDVSMIIWNIWNQRHSLTTRLPYASSTSWQIKSYNSILIFRNSMLYKNWFNAITFNIIQILDLVFCIHSTGHQTIKLLSFSTHSILDLSQHLRSNCKRIDFRSTIQALIPLLNFRSQPRTSTLSFCSSTIHSHGIWFNGLSFRILLGKRWLLPEPLVFLGSMGCPSCLCYTLSHYNQSLHVSQAQS